MQPFVLGGLVLLWTIIISNPLYIVIAILVLVTSIAVFVYKYVYGQSAMMNKLSPITPIMDNDNDNKNGLKEKHGSVDDIDMIHDDNDDESYTPIIVDLNEEDFQKVGNSKNSSDDSLSNNTTDDDVLELVNDDNVDIDNETATEMDEESDAFNELVGVDSDDDSNSNSCTLKSMNSSDSSSLSETERNEDLMS